MSDSEKDVFRIGGCASQIYKERYTQWCTQTAADADMRLELEMIDGDDEAIQERFGVELRFGTGGLRGIMGAGTARMNRYVVRRATRGLAAYMKKTGLPFTVAIGYDSRIHSQLFAQEAAEALTACGMDVWLYPRIEPTPALSWAVRKLGCGAGIMITASHNPAEYNGYKVYGSDGCQITDNVAEKIFNEILALGYFDEIQKERKGKILQIPENILDEYLERELSYLTMTLDGLHVVYTPLNGTGLECVRKALIKAGISEFVVVPEQERPDGNFTTCPSPNPEKKEAMELGLRLCESFKPDILLATDPDCDRMGTAVQDDMGDYHLLNGNEVGILLFDYICRRRQELGTMPRQPVAITTVVSTEMASVVAVKYGIELRRTLTGFKYIGEQIGKLEEDGKQECFLFGFEESFGYLSGSHVRDKDAVNACLIFCEMVAYYKEKGYSVLQVLDNLKAECGYYWEELRVFDFPGIVGMERMKKDMTRLRDMPPAELAGKKVVEIIDYLKTEKTELPASDVMEFRLQDGGRVTVRPSGTEPKIKVYLSLRETSELRINEKSDTVFENICQGLGIEIAE